MILLLTAVMERSWYTGVNVGFSPRYFKIQFNKNKFKDTIGKQLTLDPNVEFHNLFRMVGLEDTIYGTVYLGYRWKINRFFLGVNAFFSVEPYNLTFRLPTDLGRDADFLELKMHNIAVGGLAGKFGYYLTTSTALILILGFEYGLQGHAIVKNPLSQSGEKTTSIPDAGIRLGLELKTHLNDKWSFNLGFHKTILPYFILERFLPKEHKNYAIDHVSLEKTRAYVGFQYYFNRR